MASKTATPNRRQRRHPELIGLPEAADRCGVHYRTFRRWVRDGRIPATRIGPKLLKVDARDLDEFIDGGAA